MRFSTYRPEPARRRFAAYCFRHGCGLECPRHDQFVAHSVKSFLCDHPHKLAGWLSLIDTANYSPKWNSAAIRTRSLNSPTPKAVCDSLLDLERRLWVPM